MRIAVLPSDINACGTYRMAWPAECVSKIRPDWEVSLHRPQDINLKATDDGLVAAAKGIPNPKTLDLLVVQRVGSPAMFNLIKWFQREGVAVVMDNDDAMWAIDPNNTAWPVWNQSKRMHWSWTDKTAKIVDLNTVTTPALAQRYGNAEILPNAMPQAAMDLPLRTHAQCRVITVGWPGYVATHPKDLQVVGNAVRKAYDLHKAMEVAALPDKAGVAKAWGIPEDEIQAYGPFPIGREYYLGLQKLDIALVPLEDSKFNRAKSYLKALECAAMGCAVIASPTPANRELARTVPIILADTPDEWFRAIYQLVGSLAERVERVEAARKAILAGHLIEDRAERWAQAWERAINRRRRLTGRV